MPNFTSIVGGSIVNARSGSNIGHVAQTIITEAEYDMLWSSGTAGTGTFNGDDSTLYFITEN